MYFSIKAFFKILLHSCYSSLVLFFLPYAAMHETVRDDGKDIADYQSFALLAQTCLLFAVNIQVILFFLFSLFTDSKKSLGSLLIACECSLIVFKFFLYDLQKGANTFILAENVWILMAGSYS